MLACTSRKQIMRLRFFWLLACTPGLAMASSDLPPLVHDIGFSVLFAGALALLFNRFKIPSIAAFLVAGVIVGPIGAYLVTDPKSIDTIAQLGLVLLLFLIGLELDLRKLLSHGKTVIVSGLLQFPLCVLVGAALCKLLIWAMVFNPGPNSSYVPLYFGLVVAASSTLLVVKIMQESMQIDTTSGRIALSLLIFQDIWAIIVLALQPTLHDLQIGTIAISFLGIGILGTIAVLVAKYVLPICFGWIAKAPELLLGAAIAWCFGIVFLGGILGSIGQPLFGKELPLSVGPGMGALLAGASMASLPYSADVLSKVSSVKDFFVTLFFVALGMGIPMPDSGSVLIMALVLSAIVILTRYMIFFPLLYFTGLDRRNAFVSSTRLAQISEFSLVIAYLGLGLGHINSEFNSVIIFAFVITALLTPSMFKAADALHDRCGNLLTTLGFKLPQVVIEEPERHYKLALLGFHRLGASLLEELHQAEPDVMKDVLVVDFNVAGHHQATKHGCTVRYGDLSAPDSFTHLGIDRSSVVAIGIADDLLKGTNNGKLVQAVRRINPKATIIANALDADEAHRLYDLGADFVYLPHVGSAQGMLPAVVSAIEGGLHHYRTTKKACTVLPKTA